MSIARAARRSVAALCLLAPFACAHRIPADARSVVVSTSGMDCADCSPRVLRAMQQESGVYAASFDRRTAEITVKVAHDFDDQKLVAVVAREGFRGALGAGQGGYVPMPAFPPDADVKIIARAGEDVPDLATHLERGKITVFDFYADWCEPCRKTDEHMRGVLAAQKDVAYRKLDIGDWDSALARRYLGNAPELPYLLVHDAGGKRVAEITGLRLDDLDAAVASARSRKP